MAVYFHGSFGLKRPVLSRLVALGLENPQWGDRELAEPFNYGAPFSAKHRSWLHKSGLARMRLPIKLTEMGAVVFEQDPKLEALTTQWFMHHELTGDPERAEAWHFFAKEFLPRHDSFTRDGLLVGFTERFRSHSEKHFGPDGSLTKVIAAKLLECYSKDYALGALALLKQDGKRFVRGTATEQPGPWRSPEELRRAYAVQ